MPRIRAPRAATLLLLGLCSCAPRAPERDAARTGERLARPVRIVTDRWGIPHLRAESLPDLYYAWGYVTARDRLWQIMSLRQAADGERWRWLGNATLRADAGAQLFELRARAERTWRSECVDPAAAGPLERYAAGINAYLERCRRSPSRWPAELAALGVRPADWRPSDSIALMLGEGVLLDLDIPELSEAAAIRAHGEGWIERRRRFRS